jgi:hypothetical protein
VIIRVARDIVRDLSNQPVLLALVVVNVLFLAFATYTMSHISQSAERRDAVMAELAKRCN